jgi:hypothetical protein
MRWLRLRRELAFNLRMKELAAEDEARREGLLSKVFGFFFSRRRRF